MPKHTRYEALFFHQRLPRRLWRALREAGLPDKLIRRRLLGWDGSRITVPVFNRERGLARFAHLSDPLESAGLGLVEESWSSAEIYGWETMRERPRRLFITIDPWERLLVEARGLRAIGLTGDPMSFKESWVEDFQGVGGVFVAFPRYGRAFRAAKRIVELVPQARLLYLPPEVGEGGLEAFFLSLRRSREEFLRLLPPEEDPDQHEGGKAA